VRMSRHRHQKTITCLISKIVSALLLPIADDAAAVDFAVRCDLPFPLLFSPVIVNILGCLFANDGVVPHLRL
jgi:hypothetical protein